MHLVDIVGHEVEGRHRGDVVQRGLQRLVVEAFQLGGGVGPSRRARVGALFDGQRLWAGGALSEHRQRSVLGDLLHVGEVGLLVDGGEDLELEGDHGGQDGDDQELDDHQAHQHPTPPRGESRREVAQCTSETGRLSGADMVGPALLPGEHRSTAVGRLGMFDVGRHAAL